MMLTQKKLKEIIKYNKDTGFFTWNERPVSLFSHCKNPQRACNTWNTRFAGTNAGSIFTPKNAKSNYIVITIVLKGVKKRRYLAHKLAFLYINGNYNCGIIDHIDHNGMNNSWKNLRIVTHQENKKNTKIRSTNTSGITGVTWNKNKGKWQVQLATIINGKIKCIYGGLFENIKDAARKRKQMDIEYGFHKNHGNGC